MKRTELKAIWKKEEKVAHIHGRYEEEMDLPWDYFIKLRQQKDINQM